MNENMTESVKQPTRTNPFLETYDTPHETVPFDRITIEDYEEAFVEGIRREDEQLEKIINNTERPTFDNTIIYNEEGKEHYYDLLSRVSTVFFNMLSANTNDEMDALAQKLQPMLTKHANDIRLNKKLFERIKHVHRHHRKLTDEEKRLLDDEYDGLVRGGALLDEAGKEKLRQLTEELSMLSLQFSQNLLKETKAFTLHITDEAELDGLPETAREAAAQEAKEQGKEGWVFTLDFPSYSPFLTYSTQRKLRERMFMAKNTLCFHGNSEDNQEICRKIVNLRLELAQMLGYRTYADYVLKRRMASNKKNVYNILNQLIEAYKPTAIKETDGIKKLAQKLTAGKEKLEKMEPWDTPFYSHKLKLKKYNVDAEMLRPYFELKNVIKGVFGLATRLYGITFKENTEIPVYHPDVKAYEVFDKDGSYLAVLYTDFHPRNGKQSGAWMTEFQGQWINNEGKNVRPHVSLVMNFTKPTPEKPALLTLSEVETFLHEFGHALHGMFANTRFESLSGTNVWWDFVELPSQFMENYAIEKDFLKTFAFHYQTGEAIPDELIRRVTRSRNFNVALSCLRQVKFGLIDMGLYTRTKPMKSADEIKESERKSGSPAELKPGTAERLNTCMTVQFSHIMSGGYAAGYYSYKWAEVLEADAFSLFKQKGIFNQETAQQFRDNILSKGGTEHPMVLYKRFRKKEPTIKALLKRNGIKS
ncbi:MAG: M3 family metallopeptidase [Prevotella sp.]